MSNRRRPRPAGARSRLIAEQHQGEGDQVYADDCPICVALRAGDTDAALEAFFRNPESVQWDD